jgi:hypothetical protein
MVVTTPIANSLEAMNLYTGTPVGAMWYFELDLKHLAFDLLLALAAFSVVWAIEVAAGLSVMWRPSSDARYR